MVQEKTSNKQSLTTVSDKIKERLEQLDQFDDENMQEMANLSQQEYIKRIDELNNALLKAWNEDDRVKSLKIVIQVIEPLHPIDFSSHSNNNFKAFIHTINRVIKH